MQPAMMIIIENTGIGMVCMAGMVWYDIITYPGSVF
jgi:hypothetical protein